MSPTNYIVLFALAALLFQFGVWVFLVRPQEKLAREQERTPVQIPAPKVPDMFDRAKLAQIPLVPIEEWRRMRFRALSHLWFTRN